jgi:adenylate kinase
VIVSRVVILLGPPGAGKGTQARLLSAELSLPHVATGDLFRENLSNGTELGTKARAFMDSGRLVPDELVLDMLFDRLQRPDASEGYLLDGFPRTVAQAEALERWLDAEDERPSVARVLIDVEDEELIERAVGRRICGECGNIHHVKHSPPRVASRCDRCGGKLVQRADDRDQVVRERLAVYRRETRPVIDFYEAREHLLHVDGHARPDAVFEALKKCLKEAV